MKAVTEALRQVMRRKKLTYAQAAVALKVSEQTIKRFFAGDDFPVSRLTALCDLAGISVFDLMALARQDDAVKSFQLTPEQEQYFADHPHYFLYFGELRDGKSPAEIARGHGLSARSTARYQKQLEEFDLLERLEGQRVKLKVEGGLNLSKNGPLSRWIAMDFAHQMLAWTVEASVLDDPKTTHMWTMSDAMMSPASVAEMKKDLEEVVARYRKVSQREGKLLPRDATRPTAWCVALASPYEHTYREKIIDL